MEAWSALSGTGYGDTQLIGRAGGPGVRGRLLNPDRGDDEMKTIELKVPDMSCGHCVATVQSALMVVAGVEKVDVTLEGKRAIVQAQDTVGEEKLVQAVEQAGYRATSAAR